MARYQAVRGTFDVLPNQMPSWHKLEGTARDLAPRFGYQEIRTPLFEEAELFTRGMGVMAGLIEKELWTFNDKYGQKLALRTDVTTGVIRAYQQNKLYNSSLPLKVFYLAPVFLLGKEGEERSRQSHQFGFEAIGNDNPALDAEVIALAAAYCDELGIEDYTVRLNSLGGKECRPLYLQKLKDYFGSNAGQLCSTCKRKYKANPDWVLSCEEPGCKTLSQVAPTIYGMLTNDAKQHFSMLREYLEEMDLPVELDPRVVRDSEYYNNTVFEIRAGDRSLGFGGRYDTLIEKLGGKSTPAVGFAFSLEAVMEAVQDSEKELTPPSLDVLLRPEGPESARLLVPLLFTLRQRGVSAELDYTYGNGKRQKETTHLSYSYLVTLDESNAFRGTAVLRDMDEKSDEKVPVQRLRNRVLHVAGVSSDEERDGSKSGRKKLRRGRRRSEEDKGKKDDDDRKSSKKDDSGSDSDSKSRSGRRSRRSRKSRGPDDQDKRSGRSDKSDDSKDSRSSKKSRSKKGSKPRGRSDKRDQPSPPEAEPDKGGGKALVPAFNLGGGGTASAPPPKPSAEKSSKSKKAASASKNASQKGGGGGLNWSIVPGKEGS